MTGEFLLPHLDAAYNLARWMMGNDADAEDVVQEACVRALSAADGFRGGDRRAWLLTIVRNACYTGFRRAHPTTTFDETIHSDESAAASPERLALAGEIGRHMEAAIVALRPEFREVIVLRELEGLSYKAIADIVGAPMGTVMSRLSRARAELQQALAEARGRQP